MNPRTAQGHTVTTDANVVQVEVLATKTGDTIATSSGGHVLHETGYPDRWYLPRADVQLSLEPSDTTSRCPFKGEASYWSVRLPNGELLKDVAWSYEHPLDAAGEVAGELSFWTDAVAVNAVT